MSAQVTTRSFERRASLKSDFSAIDVPVRLSSVDQDIWVRPGDIIIGDADGIACLPRSLAVRVIEMVPKLVSGGSSYDFIR
jgi:regulator of RNase E activity RraA